MTKRTTQVSRLPIMNGGLLVGWPALLLGGVLLATSNGRWILPLAAWLAPVLLMSYFRQAKRLWLALILLWLTLFISIPIAWLGLWPFPPLVFAKMAAFIALWGTIPYLLDRLSAGVFKPLTQSLVFPSAFVAIDFTHSTLVGTTWGNLAYTQTENLPLVQLASVTGMWGIGFLMYWLAPVANNFWKVASNNAAALRGMVVYALVLGLVILSGSMRLTFFPPASDAMKVAMVMPRDVVDPETEEGLRFLQMFQQVFTKSDLSPAGLEDMRGQFAGMLDPLFADVRKKARAGAEMVVMSEGSLVSFTDTEDQNIIELASQVAREEQIYLGLALVKVPLQPEGKNENRLLLIDPAGEVVQSYWKHETVPVVEQPFAVPGSEAVMRHVTDMSTLGGAICYDLDSPQFLKSAGEQRIDVLMVPTGDWKIIRDIHARMAVMRAVEQGFSLVRPANHGLSIAADYQGRVLARMDYYTATEHQLSAWVPKRGVKTVYAQIGDLLAWACVMFSVLALLWMVWRMTRPSAN